MKKMALIMAIFSASCEGIAYAGSMGPVDTGPTWTGFYLGAHAGYWWSQNNSINTTGTPTFVNPLFPLGAGDVANALAALGTNHLTNNSDGFIGGGQAGYNYQYSDRWVVGLDMDIDGLTQSNENSETNRVVNLAHSPGESYTATVSINKKINYLGTVRGRLGYLYTPSILLYGVAGLAYGGVTLNQSFVANESLGAAQYPTVLSQNNFNQTRAGWTAGVGGEWMFRPQWSAKLEYTYDDLGSVNSNTTLTQINNLAIPPATWAAAGITSSSRFSLGTVRVGLSYHFA